MASTHVARACVIAVAVFAAIILPAAAGAAQTTGGGQAVALAQPQPQLAVDVNSVSPSFAEPGHRITINGRVWNGTRLTLRDLTVRLSFSTSALYSQAALDSFESGSYPTLPLLSVAPKTISKLRPRHGVAWTITLPVSTLRLSCFGVYPLNVAVTNATGTLAANRPVPLPFWPNRASACPQSMPRNRFPISWIWPLIDSPRQGPCPGLLNNSLATSLAPNGRLRNLLDVGTVYASSAHLTWAIDPALLDNAHTMSSPFAVGTSASCENPSQHAPDQNAASWLAKVKRSTTGHPVFVTPYADVDMVGLAHYAPMDLGNSFADGQALADRLLGRDGKPAQVPAGIKKLSDVAWPANGQPSQGVLQTLGAMRVGTVIMAMPSNLPSPTPGAVTSVPDGVGTQLKVLLANNSLSSLLVRSAAASTQPGTSFDLSQEFLAETAMFVTQAPADQRPILVTPPRRWDPGPALASQLLDNTVNAPWLRPVPIGELARQPEQHNYVPPVPTFVRPGLRLKVLKQLAKLDGSVSLLSSIWTNHQSRLSRAVYGLESSAWAGSGAAQSEAMLSRTGKYVARQFAGLSIGAQQAIHVTLGGRAGSVPVSIHNLTKFGVTVALRVTSSNDTVIPKQKQRLYVVPPDGSNELKLSVNATQTGKATLKLSLIAPDGTPLPVKPFKMTIRATNLGTVALVIFAAALAVFVAVSAAQALRRGRPGTDEEESEHESGDPESTEPASPEAESTGAGGTDPPAAHYLTDNVVADQSQLSRVGRPAADRLPPAAGAGRSVPKGIISRGSNEEIR